MVKEGKSELSGTGRSIALYAKLPKQIVSRVKPGEIYFISMHLPGNIRKIKPVYGSPFV